MTFRVRVANRRVDGPKSLSRQSLPAPAAKPAALPPTTFRWNISKLPRFESKFTTAAQIRFGVTSQGRQYSTEAPEPFNPAPYKHRPPPTDLDARKARPRIERNVNPSKAVSEGRRGWLAKFASFRSLNDVLAELDSMKLANKSLTQNMWDDIVARYVVNRDSLVQVLQTMRNFKQDLNQVTIELIVSNLIKRNDMRAVETIILGTEHIELMGVTYAAVSKFFELNRKYAESVRMYDLARKNNAQINFTLTLHSMLSSNHQRDYATTRRIFHDAMDLGLTSAGIAGVAILAHSGAELVTYFDVTLPKYNITLREVDYLQSINGFGRRQLLTESEFVHAKLLQSGLPTFSGDAHLIDTYMTTKMTTKIEPLFEQIKLRHPTLHWPIIAAMSKYYWIVLQDINRSAKIFEDHEAAHPILPEHDVEYALRLYYGLIHRLVSANRIELVEPYFRKVSLLTPSIPAVQTTPWLDVLDKAGNTKGMLQLEEMGRRYFKAFYLPQKFRLR